ncbi:MAG TPA: ABC transporter permease [Actinomycetota bacterium]|nr:ABC transporter permease [Actinomycetota bacterium]
MWRYVVRRALFSIPVLLISSVLVFVVIKATTDPVAAVSLSPRFRPEDLVQLRIDLGLDRPPVVQYLSWLGDFVQGDWGNSIITNRPVYPDMMEALGNTILLGLAGVGVSLLIGVGVGIYSALRQYSFFDYLATGAAFLGLSMPTFWFALMLQLILGVYLTRWFGLTKPIFYTTGMSTPGVEGFDIVDRLQHITLPTIVLAVQIIAVYSRYMRASMLEVLQSDFLRTARAKGVRERRVLVRHGMRNALIPLTTQVALDVGSIAGGLIITETIFSWPGMGRLFISAIDLGDYTVVLPWVMVTVTFVILFNLVADIMYAALDPRIRYA